MSRHSFGDKVSRLKVSFGIRTRLVMLALILVVPLMLDRVFVLEHTRGDQVKLATDELAKLAGESATAQREIISSVEAMLRSAAYIQVASEQTGRGCAILRASLRVEMPWITSLSVVGKNGRIACSTAPNYVGINVTDRPYYQKTVETHGFVLSDLTISTVSQKPLLLAAYPTSAVEGGEPSVILASMNMDWMGKLMAGLGGRPGVQAALIDSKGMVVAAQPPDRDVIGRPYAGVGGGERKGELDSGSALLTVNGVKKLVSVVRIPETDTRMVVSIDHETMLAPINHDIEKAYVQLALVSLLALLGAWFVGEQFIIRPIRLMTNMANRFGQGDLSARATGNQIPPEFKPLALAFNVMAAQLAERERDLIATNDRLTVMASIDLVSGLANRRGFQSRLEFEWLKMQQIEGSLALMMIDVDYFKLFNDSYGHPEGDACLGRVGEALAAIANETMGFAARYGGEEFCLLLPGANRARAIAVGEMVREAVERLAIPHAMSEFGYVTVSVGVSLITPGGDQRPTELLEAADAALYAAKHRGRNTVVEHGLVGSYDSAIAMAS
ncbi:MAG: diguanylate cyclase [Bradyrhizobium sp.]|nr:diguanylate cyclase [Bradyrhizobium sp.]